MVAPAVLAAGIGAGASVIGKGIDAVTSKFGSDEAWDRQKKMAQNQVQWRVADSVKAGLHPLAALGMAPANVGGQWMGTDFGSLGQDIGRAAEALSAPEDKVSSQMIRLQVERGTLENELLRTQIASQRMRMAQDAAPGVGGNANAAVLNVPGYGDWNVTNKTLGQDMENAYSEWGNIPAGMAALHDWMVNNGINPKDPVGSLAGRALDWTKRAIAGPAYFVEDAAGNRYPYNP